MARVPQRGTHQPSREGQELQREGRELARDVEALERQLGDISRRRVPAGAIVLVSEEQGAPAGWLLAHGGSVGRRTYAELFRAIGETYGAGDGVTTFDLPDLSAAEPAGFDYVIHSGVL